MDPKTTQWILPSVSGCAGRKQFPEKGCILRLGDPFFPLMPFIRGLDDAQDLAVVVIGSSADCFDFPVCCAGGRKERVDVP
ncbi:MAG: hypothetical protein BWY82_02383 [Verrucomicrobia bacterium ADurb.Bin474]|nr:MAG: hypothetical protein BWY82_02383 [Verrucomicrobia bacterium ADurb.Bin474]